MCIARCRWPHAVDRPRSTHATVEPAGRHACQLGWRFFFFDPPIHGYSKIRTDPRRIRIDPGFGGFVLPPVITVMTSVGSRGAVVSAALSKRKVAGSIPTIGDFHTVGPCKKAVFACLATDVK